MDVVTALSAGTPTPSVISGEALMIPGSGRTGRRGTTRKTVGVTLMPGGLLTDMLLMHELIQQQHQQEQPQEHALIQQQQHQLQQEQELSQQQLHLQQQTRELIQQLQDHELMQQTRELMLQEHAQKLLGHHLQTRRSSTCCRR